MPEVVCFNCGKTFRRSKSAVRVRNYCSRSCAQKKVGPFISQTATGRKTSEKSKEKLREYKGAKASGWKGGKPICKVCGKKINYRSQYCQNHKHLLWDRAKWEKAWNGSRAKLCGKMPKNTQQPGNYGNVKRGYYDINGKTMFMRSKWEANYALYLDFLIKQGEISGWEYEVEAFIFEAIQFGTRSYRPDFKIVNGNGTIEYHEVKGRMTPKSKTQLKRMAKYYPEIKIVLITKREYNDIKNKLGRVVGFY